MTASAASNCTRSSAPLSEAVALASWLACSRSRTVAPYCRTPVATVVSNSVPILANKAMPIAHAATVASQNAANAASSRARIVVVQPIALPSRVAAAGCDTGAATAGWSDRAPAVKCSCKAIDGSCAGRGDAG